MIGKIMTSDFYLFYIIQISQLICLLFRLCQENKVAEVQHRLQALPRPAVQRCQQGSDEMVDDSDDVSTSYFLLKANSTGIS